MELTPETLARLAEVDPDRIRAAQLASSEDRRALTILYAFHAELAKVPELVSEPMLGAIRYQWWRDAIAEIYEGEVRRHEVATPLATLVRERGLARFWLDRLIDARERDLDPRPFADVQAARDYARATSGTLMRIAVAVLGGEDTDHIAGAGQAWGLTGLARSYRFYKGSMLQNLAPADLVADALTSLPAIRYPAPLMPAVGYAAFVPLYARAMSRPGHDPARNGVQIGGLRKQLRLGRAALSGKLI